MKLSRRIRDMVRAGLTSPPQLAQLGKARSPARLEAQLERIGKSLAQAAAREKQLRDDLARAEEEGRERDAVRLRRQLADLAQSSDELRKALGLIEARIEMEHERAREREEEVEARPSEEVSLLGEEGESAQASLKEKASLPVKPSLPVKEEDHRDDDFTARKSRLAAPDEK